MQVQKQHLKCNCYEFIFQIEADQIELQAMLEEQLIIEVDNLKNLQLEKQNE